MYQQGSHKRSLSELDWYLLVKQDEHVASLSVQYQHQCAASKHIEGCTVSSLYTSSSDQGGACRVCRRLTRV